MHAIKRATAFVAAAVLAGGIGAPTGSAAADDPVVVGFIGSFASDTGLSTLRGAEIAIEELNAAGGALGGREIKLVKADTGQDVTEGIKGLRVSRRGRGRGLHCLRIDRRRFARLAAAYGGIPNPHARHLDFVLRNHREGRGLNSRPTRCTFMNIGNDWALGTMYVDFGKEVLADQMGWKTTVILQEDTAYAAGVQGFVVEVLEGEAGIKVLDTIVYDYNATDFAPIFNKAVGMDPDFIYLISSVKSEVPSSQYVKLQVPKPMTGINVSAFGREFWDDTGGQGGRYVDPFAHARRRDGPRRRVGGIPEDVPGEVRRFPAGGSPLQRLQRLSWR